MKSIYEEVADLEKAGEAVALCIIIYSRGSTPRHDGSKMLVFPDGHIQGSVGGGDVENRVIQEALAALKDNKTRKLNYKMISPEKGDPGICGGEVEVYVEPILPAPYVVIIGGGHVGRAVARIVRWLGWKVAVSDDRPEFCTPEANPDAHELYPIPMAEIPESVKITPYTYLILTTRGMNVDVEGLPALLKTPAAFIGIIGSKRRWALTRKALLEIGVPEEQVNRIHSPLGLELQAETPEEIAISIVAELVMQKNGGTGARMRVE